jgi:hypothetical protein
MKLSESEAHGEITKYVELVKLMEIEKNQVLYLLDDIFF